MTAGYSRPRVPAFQRAKVELALARACSRELCEHPLRRIHPPPVIRIHDRLNIHDTRGLA